jgi:hypothetical protein
MPLTGGQINWLLGGYDIALLKGHKTLYYEAGNERFSRASGRCFCYTLLIKLR